MEVQLEGMHVDLHLDPKKAPRALRRGRPGRLALRFVLVCAALLAVGTTLVLSAPGSLSRTFWSSSSGALFSACVPNGLQDAISVPNPPGASSSEVLDNGRTDEVQWDGHSLLLRGQRVFLHSGEFHPFRLPVPDLWPDILEKFAAAGLNGVSIYTHWGLLNPSPGVLDFDSWRALGPFYEAARAAGLWVVLRPGPYINAETTAGGIAHWAASRVAGNLRTNDSDFFESWQGYVKGLIEETKEWQITRGGPVIAVQIDNEYEENERTAAYMQALEDAFKSSELLVPLTYNDPNERESFVNGTGSADIYGLDSYPQRFDCSNPQTWFPVDESYHDYHSRINPHQPFYSPEFQAGAYDAWGPTAPGYEKCRELTGPAFMSVFYKSLWASNAKMINYYMVYGGTSWGGLPFPGVYTSYDYGSAIGEARTLNEKYTELKLQGLFLRSSPAFSKTDVVGNSSAASGVVRVSDDRALIVLLRNPDSGAGFWIARQRDSTSIEEVTFNLTVTTSNGTFDIPKTVHGVTLSGREAKTIVTDYAYGASGLLRWSTAPILFAGRIGARDVLLVYGAASQSHELATSRKIYSLPAGSAVLTAGGFHTLEDTHDSLILFADAQTAGTVWAPALRGDSPLGQMWEIGTNASVLIAGPYLVRSAVLLHGGTTLALRGDLNESSLLQVLAAPPRVRRVTWNGKPVRMGRDYPARGSWSGVVEMNQKVNEVEVPKLTGWKYADSLPERFKWFDDGGWMVADQTRSNAFLPMKYGDGRVLFGCDYGFCENVVLWRGHFFATGEEKSVNLLINGGEAFAASVFLNGDFLGTAYGNSTNNINIIDEVDKEYIFPPGTLVARGDNVITIVQDNMGLDESDDPVDVIKSPRGIRGFQLNPSGNFSEWRVQGKLGGYTNFPDRMRGILNDGGLFGERAGWHLPGFDTSSWPARHLRAGLPGDLAGVGFFVTTFELTIPEGLDVMLSFNFDGNAGEHDVPYRALLFVNGWMMGKRVGNLGPQTKFPVHEGILDYHGVNTVAVALWAMESVEIRPTLELVVDAILDGGVGPIRADNPSYAELR